MVVYSNPINLFNGQLRITNTKDDNKILLFDLLGRSIPIEQKFNSSRNITKLNLS